MIYAGSRGHIIAENVTVVERIMSLESEDYQRWLQEQGLHQQAELQPGHAAAGKAACQQQQQSNQHGCAVAKNYIHHINTPDTQNTAGGEVSLGLRIQTELPSTC